MASGQALGRLKDHLVRAEHLLRQAAAPATKRLRTITARLESALGPVIAPFIPSAKTKALAFRVLLATALVLVTFLFVSLLEKQNGALNPNTIRGSLASTGVVSETGSWAAAFSSCETTANGVRACEELVSEPALTFPAKEKGEKIYASSAGKANTVKLTYTLGEADKALLGAHDFVALVLPRSVQNTVKLRVGSYTSEVHGAGLDAVFSLYSEELLQAGSLSLEIDYEGFPWFGPADLPIALVEKDSVAVYTSLTHRQISSSNLSRQMEIGFPLLLAAMAIVLDHSRVFAWLSLYAGARALRSYIPFLVENGTELHTNLELTAYAAGGFAFAFLVIFVLEISGFTKVKAIHRAALVVTSVTGFLIASRFDPVFWVRADLWSDFLGASVALPFCIHGLASHLLQKKQTGEAKPTEDEDRTLVSRALIIARMAIVTAAVALHAWANGTDLFQVSTEAYKNTLDWKHTALLPCLVTAALLDVGSTAKKMLTFGKEMAAKALIERELSVGKEVQHRMLPRRRKSGDLWNWRSFYFPAQALAGDWYDIRELQFADGRRLLGAIVADVTGHGVGSSLATSVICSHWSLWCAEACGNAAPADKSAREALLVTAPFRVNAGLLALPQNEQCTAIFALVDPSAGEITFCSGGHPGIIVSDGKSLRYLTSAGERLGAAGVDSPVWNAKTEPLVPGEIACLYSDGIVPPGDTVSSFAASLRRKFKKQAQPLLPLLWRQVLENRRVFRVQHDIEDDMTLLALELKGTAEATGDPGSETSTVGQTVGQRAGSGVGAA